jgi:uncharacterized protein YndB with AHSA1/START domain
LKELTMTHERFVYVTYIRATPDKVWQGLTDPEFTRQYWMHENVSDWKVGSSWAHRRADGVDDVVGEVLEADPPNRLVTSWVAPAKASDPERVSKVTYETAVVGGVTRLTVTHEHLPSDLLAAISGGWPSVLSNLKSLLETGEALGDIWGRGR